MRPGSDISQASTHVADAVIVLDHVRGSLRGTRQEFHADDTPVRFGRHPDCEVNFHPRRDLDASSRHATLASTNAGYVLRDVGSSNGTFIDGKEEAERRISPGEAVLVEFGRGGPLVRIFLGDRQEIPPPMRTRLSAWMSTGAPWPFFVAGLILAAVIAAIAWFTMV